jgi:hypothetical protein
MTDPVVGSLFDPLLKILASQVDDLEGLRIASENRYRQLTRVEPDEDGQVRGLALPGEHREVRKVRTLIDGIAELETAAIRQMERHMRYSVWSDWLKTAPGVGEKTLARLLAAIGDPYWHPVHRRPRMVSELWAYAGYDVVRADPGHLRAGSQFYSAGVARSRRKGQKVTWSGEARKRAWVIATGCVKQPATTRYRQVYDAARVKHVEAIHQSECVRCGPSGKPAPVGSPLSDGHKHARAVRAIGKEVLRDLWVEARRLHEERTSMAA